MIKPLRGRPGRLWWRCMQLSCLLCLELLKDGGAGLVNAPLYGAFAHAESGGDVADGVPGGKACYDLARCIVSGCGLLDGGADGVGVGGVSADRGGGAAAADV